MSAILGGVAPAARSAAFPDLTPLNLSGPFTSSVLTDPEVFRRPIAVANSPSHLSCGIPDRRSLRPLLDHARKQFPWAAHESMACLFGEMAAFAQPELPETDEICPASDNRVTTSGVQGTF